MLSLIVLAVFVGQTLGGPSSRIIGGSPADIADFPFQCSLEYLGSISCGCVIYQADKVLTAAHCVEGRVTSSLGVYAGSTSMTVGGVLKNVSKIIKHENYDDGTGTFANDIAILYLSDPFDLSDPNIEAGILAPSDAPDFVGEDCTMTGWGLMDNGNVLPDDLRKLTARVITGSECQRKMNDVYQVTIRDMHLCIMTAGKNGGTCTGDSGGPLKCRGYIAGVTSWGATLEGECQPDYPSVFTRISHFYDWISRH